MYITDQNKTANTIVVDKWFYAGTSGNALLRFFYRKRINE